MTNYRIFLLGFLTVSWFFLSGLNKAVDNDMSAMEKQKTAVELISVEAENTRKLLKTRQVKVKSVKANPQKTKQTTIKAADAGDNNPINSNGLEKPLDLSVPFKGSEDADQKIEQKSATQNRVTNIFAPETQKKPRPLELDGDFLMSPEPEAEKQKSVDGAGIVIKLKP